MGYNKKTGNSKNPHPYEEPKPAFKIIDLVLEELNIKPTFTLLNVIKSSIRTNSEIDVQYYGNSDYYEIEYITLSEFEKLIK